MFDGEPGATPEEIAAAATMAVPAPPTCAFCEHPSSRTTYTGLANQSDVPFTCIVHSQAGTRMDPYWVVTVSDELTETPADRDARIKKQKRIEEWKKRDRGEQVTRG